MIVRISNEGQYELADAQSDGLNELDNAAVSACEASDEARFREIYDQLLGYIRERGRPLAEDELTESDLILPPADVSLEEAKEEFSGEGLIPG